jgi:hypothetical protein
MRSCSVTEKVLVFVGLVFVLAQPAVCHCEICFVRLPSAPALPEDLFFGREMPRNGYPYFVLGADRSRPGQDEQAGLLNFRPMSSLKDNGHRSWKRSSVLRAFSGCLGTKRR